MPATTIVFRTHPSFPTELRDIPEWPTRLFCHGRIEPAATSVAIVGARSASKAMMEKAHVLAAELAGRGARVISGGALGIDSAAHAGALTAGGTTIAVMACGLHTYYPKRNRRLFEAILASGGAIVSPFEEGSEPLRGRFVKRNRIIAALANVVVVVEAGLHSGSLHTARFALGLGRTLAVVPGSPGCEALRAHGARSVQSATDVLSLLDGQSAQPPTNLPVRDSPSGHVLHTLSSTRPRSLQEIAQRVGMSTREVARILLGLELELFALALPGQRYLLSPLASAALHG